MPLAAGTRLGPYEISDQIGVGGMGEVYRATDTNLARRVAVKVLPEAFAADADRLARFDREAKALASLNHPHIAQIYGVERSGSTTALVMELVEGATLAERITGVAIPVDEALPLARQIALALEAAHEQGIVHRDLKPANVKVRPDGTVKVLDFGLARTSGLLGPGRASGSAGTGGAGLETRVAGVTQLPTITTPALTQAGVILGTASYMSPEQARGAAADERSDIWSFGCVLFEMLTGHRAFEADTVAEALAAVLRGEPRWDLLPHDLPPVVGAFLRRCLAKDPRDRMHHIADVRLALEGAFDVAPAADNAAVPRHWRLLAAGALAAVALVASLSTWAIVSRDVEAPVSRLQMSLPRDQSFYFNGRHLLTISPDGTLVAYVAGLGLWLHPLDQLEAKPVPGAEADARSPFFSSDGQSIGYYTEGELRRVSVTGGAPVTITKAVNPWGASWADDGMIYYGQGPDGIWKVPASGGTGERLFAVKDGEQAHGPHLLPDHEWILYTLLPEGVGSWNRAQIVAQSMQTQERVTLIDGGRDARYLRTGHLVYALNGSLLVVPFDVGRRQITGSAVPVVNDVFDSGTLTGAVHYDVANNGSLAYAPRPGSALLQLMWVDRNGRAEAIPADPRPFSHPRVSPDGTRIAAEVNEPNNTDVWVGDTRRGIFTRLTRSEDVDTDPIWTPDSTRLVYTSVRGTEGLFIQPADGSGEAVHITDASGGVRAMSWTKDGRLLYEELAGDEIRLITPDGKSAAEGLRLFNAPEYFNERLPSLSPDGRWLAYQSTESGTMEVYLRPFPDLGSLRRQISVGGGFAPLWSPDGSEIYYRSATDLLGVKIKTSPSLEIEAPQRLFSLGDYVLAGTRGIRYDVGPDGRFLLLKDTGTPAAQGRVVVVQNWFEDVKDRAPAN